MGQLVSKLYSRSMREVKMYNLERRAEKVISQDKPTPAPKHPSVEKELQRLNEENVSTEYLTKKSEQLDEYLKKVFVTSPDAAPSMKRIINPDRPMPTQTRHSGDQITYGYSEIEETNIPEGQVSLKQALHFISDHQSDKETHSNKAIAAKYKLPLTTTDEILEHFKLFNLHVYKKDIDPDKLTYYEKLNMKFQAMTVRSGPQVIKEIHESKTGTTSEKESTEAKDVKNTDLKVDVTDHSSSNKNDGGKNR